MTSGREVSCPTYGSGAPSARSDSQLLGGVSGSSPTNYMLSPVLSDAVSSALNREPVAFQESVLVAASIAQSQISAPRNFPLQKSQFGNLLLAMNMEGVPSVTRLITRTSIAIQALPAQTLTSVPQQRSRNSFNTLTPQGPSLASQTSTVPSVVDSFNTASTPIERQQQYSRAHLSTLQMPRMSVLHCRNTHHHRLKSLSLSSKLHICHLKRLLKDKKG